MCYEDELTVTSHTQGNVGLVYQFWRGRQNLTFDRCRKAPVTLEFSDVNGLCMSGVSECIMTSSWEIPHVVTRLARDYARNHGNRGNQGKHNNKGNHGDKSSLTMVTKTAFGFRSQSRQRKEMHSYLQIKCPLLLSDFNQTWNASTNLTKSPKYKIL
jgi:hypothetical protein